MVQFASIPICTRTAKFACLCLGHGLDGEDSLSIIIPSQMFDLRGVSLQTRGAVVCQINHITSPRIDTEHDTRRPTLFQ